jgi:hypothetical protein
MKTKAFPYRGYGNQYGATSEKIPVKCDLDT